MFKIGEFSRLTKVSVRMLRYYDGIGLFKPEVVDQFTGYRLYSASQIPELQKIILLRDMGFHVTEIASMLASWEPMAVTEALEAKRQEVLEAIGRELQRVNKIDTAIRDFQHDQIEVHYNIIVKEVPSYQILSLRERIPDYFCEGRLWERLYAFVEAKRIELLPGINNLAIFHEEGGMDGGVEVEAGVLVRRPGQDEGGFTYRETEAVADMACIMVYGPYENIGPAYRSFAYWLEGHQHYEMAGPTRQICHIGSYNEADSGEFLTEVQTPIRVREGRF